MIIPIGTSRIHESLNFFPPDSVAPLGCGYFHSTGQVLDLLTILAGERGINSSESRWFFRKDQTTENQFDDNLWNENIKDSLKRLRDIWHQSTALIIEITSPRICKWNNFHINTNPNSDRQATYEEVWKIGYYNLYEKAMKVETYNESVEEQMHNIGRIMDLVSKHGKKTVFLGHLVDPLNPHPTRQKNNSSLKEAFDGAIQSREGGNFFWYECGHLVKEFGFRILPDGTTDIHHLPWQALPLLAKDMFMIFESE